MKVDINFTKKTLVGVVYFLLMVCTFVLLGILDNNDTWYSSTVIFPFRGEDIYYNNTNTFGLKSVCSSFKESFGDETHLHVPTSSTWKWMWSILLVWNTLSIWYKLQTLCTMCCFSPLRYNSQCCWLLGVEYLYQSFNTLFFLLSHPLYSQSCHTCHMPLYQSNTRVILRVLICLSCFLEALWLSLSKHLCIAYFTRHSLVSITTKAILWKTKMSFAMKKWWNYNNTLTPQYRIHQLI